eukprot:GHVS01082857.1.p1 GENE.GHVS01082857.1~~GHVS01082857.1.p1  ORF type:complete len:296 (+),score=91.02 GHVS01082857.1:226-1113(+)
MDNTEEQALEAEALESLFIEGELTVLDPNKKFILALLPSGCLPDGQGDKCYAAVNLMVEFTASYPQQPPFWALEDVKGLDGDQVKEMQEIVRSTMDANLCMPMVYEVAEALTTFLTMNNRPTSSMHDQMMEQQQRRPKGAAGGTAGKEEEEDDSDYSPSEGSEEDEEDGSDDQSDGEQKVEKVGRRGKRRDEETKGLTDKDLVREDLRCKHEDFAKWTEAFRLEMVEKGTWKGSASIVASENKSGRQLFEMHSPEAVDGVAGTLQANVFWDDADLFEGEEVDVEEEEVEEEEQDD